MAKELVGFRARAYIPKKLHDPRIWALKEGDPSYTLYLGAQMSPNGSNCLRPPISCVPIRVS